MSENLLESLRSEQKNWPWETKARDELNENPESTGDLLLELKGKIKEYAAEHKNFRPQVRMTHLNHRPSIIFVGCSGGKNSRIEGETC